MNPAGAIAFVDVETTSVRPDRRAWEVGVIVRRPGRALTEFHAFVAASDLDLGGADHKSLAVGRFHERHPEARRHPDLPWPAFTTLPSEAEVMRSVEWLTRGAHLCGWNVAFDAATLDARMRSCGISPSFSYRHIEVRSLAAGYLAGNGGPALTPPVFWDADDINDALRIPPVPDGDRHTAMGDARWAMSIYDRVVGASPTPGGDAA